MPKKDVRPQAILEALKKVDIVSELLDERRKEQEQSQDDRRGKGFRRQANRPLGGLAYLLPGEVTMSPGEWGGNTFYFSLDNELEVYGAPRTSLTRARALRW